MTARVITITSGKGGVGKTTTTANLGVALAMLGNRVVCLDADIGLRNLDVVMGLENRIVYDLVDVVEGRAKLRKAMIKDKRLKEELYLIPAAQTRDKTAVSPSDMIRVCEELRPLVDFVLIDSPAGIERGFRNAVAPSDEVLVVTNPEVSSVRDADRIIGLIEAEGKSAPLLVINRVKPEMVKRGDMLSPEDVIDILAIELIGLVPEDESILVSTNRGAPAAMLEDRSRAGEAFMNIGRRLMGNDVDFLPLEEDMTWVQRMFRRLGLAGREESESASTNSRSSGDSGSSGAPSRAERRRKAARETGETPTPPTPTSQSSSSSKPASGATGGAAQKDAAGRTSGAAGSGRNEQSTAKKDASAERKAPAGASASEEKSSS
jgi:septum site-determining protein MinD